MSELDVDDFSRYSDILQMQATLRKGDINKGILMQKERINAPEMQLYITALASLGSALRDRKLLPLLVCESHHQVQEEGFAIKEEDYKMRVPRSQRGGEIIEPLVRDQWFVKMQPLAQPALKVSFLKGLDKKTEQLFGTFQVDVKLQSDHSPRTYQ